MTYEKIFTAVKKAFLKADIKKLNQDFAFQFNITGEGEGIFYACYKDGVLSVEPYDYKDRDVIFTSDGKTIVDVAEGKLPANEALVSGKLIVDGNFELAKTIGELAAASKKKAAKPAAKAPAVKAEKPAVKPAAKKTTKTTVKSSEKK